MGREARAPDAHWLSDSRRGSLRADVTGGFKPCSIRNSFSERHARRGMWVDQSRRRWCEVKGQDLTRAGQRDRLQTGPKRHSFKIPGRLLRWPLLRFGRHSWIQQEQHILSLLASPGRVEVVLGPGLDSKP